MVRSIHRRQKRRADIPESEWQSSSSSWAAWQRDAEREMHAIDQLGPLARQAFNFVPRELTAANICKAYGERKSPWHPKWNPDCKVNWKDPDFDAAFAAFLLDEYQKRTGVDARPFVRNIVATPIKRRRR